ncbi:MAG: GTP-binding protein [Candidatus Krumholzibacteriia bacterium]|jgi:GTP-binding protein
MEVEFVISCPDLPSLPEPGLPEFAFLGRSNCGKSSLINLFLDRNNMARISGKPGKTRLFNFFRIDDRFLLVDLPGYGYAKVSKRVRAEWKVQFSRYIAGQRRPLVIFQLLDSRHQPSADDLEVAEWIRASGHPSAVALTKIDKVGTNSRAKRFTEIIDALGMDSDTPVFPTSAAKKLGRDEVVAWVDAVLAANDAPA